jgi:hypothetical protein
MKTSSLDNKKIVGISQRKEKKILEKKRKMMEVVHFAERKDI